MDICVFCASANLNGTYRDAAIQVGNLIGQRGHSLIYGGSDYGLMGVVGRAARESGGRVKAILPKIFEHAKGHEHELLIAEDLRHRKALMEIAAGGYIALAGGLGTFDEIFDVLVSKQIGVHSKPLALINTDGIYDPFDKLIDHLIKQGTVREDHKQLYSLVQTPEEAFDFLESYVPVQIAPKREA